MIKRWLSLTLALLMGISLISVPLTGLAQEDSMDYDPIDYVNPLIGTQNFEDSNAAGLAPFVTTPFGMTNFTPQTRENYIGGISYEYADTAITGFLASHQPAIWMGDYGYVNVMPEIDSVKTRKDDRKLTFSHEDEVSTPYYYKVKMDAGNGRSITTELTATDRCAMYNFTFPQNAAASILVEAARWGSSGAAVIDVEKQEISGYNADNMSAHLSKTPPQSLKGYYVIQFSKPFTVKGTYNGHQLTADSTRVSGSEAGAYVSFATAENEVVQVKIGTSFISVEQARQNLEQELPAGWDKDNFDTVKNQLKKTWEDKLNLIEIYGASEDEKHIFYTGMYHAMLYPRKFYEETDEGNRYYSPYDEKIHDGVSYTDYSLWDTFRAENSLLTLLVPEQIDSMVQSLLQNYQEGGYMPKWPNPYYTNIMIGTHADSIVAEAINKGFDGFDYDLAYEAVYKDAIVPQEGDLNNRWNDRQNGALYEARGGLSYYKALGYVPNETTAENASRTLEFAYDDWCVAEVARALGKENDYRFFINRSQNYRNAIDPNTHYASGRDLNGNWGGGEFTESNSLRYTWFAPHDPQGLIDYSGLDFYNNRLVEAFDRRELAHENEQSHNYAYLFDYSGRPDLAQKYARQVLRESYSNTMAGMLGNDDCGQMSAWYIFSAMGFYPANPASGDYMIGSPIFDKVVIHNPQTGKDFEIVAHNNPDDNIYIQSATLNGEPLTVPCITYNQIIAGGNVTFEMSPTPSKWAADYKVEALPYYEDAENPEEGYVPAIRDSEAQLLGHNLASAATVEATSCQDANPASYMTDGDYTTGFVSANLSAEDLQKNPFTITLTWNAPQEFNTLSVWGNYAKGQGLLDVDIAVLNEEGEWKTLAQNVTFDWQTDAESAEQAVVTLGNVSDVYGVRLRVNKANLAWSHFAISELEVYKTGIDLAQPAEVRVQTHLNRNTLTGLYLNGKSLTKDVDYTLDAQELVTIKADCFAGCPVDQNAQLKLTFSYGRDILIPVPVYQSSGVQAYLVATNIVKDATIDVTHYADKDGDVDLPDVSLKDGDYDIGYISKDIPDNAWLESNPYYITFTWDDDKQFREIALYSNYAQDQGPTDMDVEIVNADGEWKTVAEHLTIDWKTNADAAEKSVLDIGSIVSTSQMRIKINSAHLVWRHIALREVEIMEEIVVIPPSPRDVTIQMKPKGQTLTQVQIGNTVLDAAMYTVDATGLLTISGKSFAGCIPGETARVLLRFDSGRDVTMDIPVIGSKPNDDQDYQLGDVNGSGTVDVIDALMALQAAAGKIDLTAPQKKAADVDGKSGVSAVDALMILQRATKKISSFS